MIFPKEVQTLHRNILEYLQFGKFETTHECFDHEIRSKIVTKKLLASKHDLAAENTPELFRMMKGVSKQDAKQKAERDALSEMTDNYLDLLSGTRQIFSLAVKLMGLVEKNKKVELWA